MPERKEEQGVARLTISSGMFTGRTAHSELGKSVDQVISFLLDRFTLVILRGTRSTIIATEGARPRLLHAASIGVNKGDGCWREHQLACGRMDNERNDHAGDEGHDKVKQPGSKVDSGKPGRSLLLTPGPKTGNVLNGGENANNNGHVEAFDVSAHLVGGEFLLLGRVEVQTTGHGSNHCLGVDNLLSRC